MIVSNEEILDLWLQRGEWIYSQSDLQHYIIEGRELEGGYIFAEWKTYVSRCGQNLQKLLAALDKEYNPLNNYDLTEQAADGEKRDSHSTTPTGTITVETTPFATGLNSTGDGAQTGKTTTETSYQNASTTTDYTNTKTIPDNEGQQVTGFHTASQHFLRRFGNIGVKGNAQLIAEEWDIRYREAVREFVDRFFAHYCYYVG